MIHGDILGERSRLSPDKIALISFPTRHECTYGELNNRAIRCARMLTERCGIARGERVAILAKNRVEFLDVFFAAGKTGIIVVPLHTRLTAAELATILRNSGARCLIYDREFAGTVEQLKRDVSIPSWIALDDPPSGDLNYNDGVAAASAQDWKPTHCDPEDIYCLLYTSGTTGEPKGVMVPHRMIAWNGYNTAVCWQLRDTDISPVFTPIYHAGGLAAFLIPIFAAGGTVLLHRDFDVHEILRTIERERCTVALGVPTIFKMLLGAPEFSQVDLSHVRWFISGGAPLPIDLIAEYQRRGVVLKQGYGLTEVGVNCFTMSSEDARRKAGSVGRPLMFTQARLTDSNGNDAPAGEVGELLLRGPHTCKGYWNDPEATAAALDPEGWFHTGDLARRDEDGFFYIVGRSKDMFISGGVNVYPIEVEAELLKHEAVRDAAVIGVMHETWGEVGVAFIVSSRELAPTADELTGFLARRLAKYKIPRQFVFVENLPRTPYGKVTKAELRVAFQRLQNASTGNRS
ncbi:MAG: long-chain fatty acid--CoA ligase [Candidatus Acidiferrales bacterium]